MSGDVARFAERHEYGCGKGVFPDLECGCDGGPFVTEHDLIALSGNAKCEHPARKVALYGEQHVCACGTVLRFERAGDEA